MKSTIITGVIILMLAGCKDNTGKIQRVEYNFKFSEQNYGWNILFSDYPPGQEEFYELAFERSPLPTEIDDNEMSIKVSGNNHSDDLLSVIYKKIDRLKPNSFYEVTFTVDFANKSEQEFGIGGSPNLAIGVGGISYEPKNTNEEDGTIYRPNFESSLQSYLSNDILQMIGNIGFDGDMTDQYKRITRNNEGNPIPLRTNNKGELWLLIGTDSGFEGITTIYYTGVKVKLVLVGE